MRAVLQCVSSCTVQVKNQSIGSIEKGLCILLAITNEDTQQDIEWLVHKITNLRIFGDESGKMNLSVQDIAGDILVISQFTLYANSKKGNRPSYTRSARPELAIPLYESFLTHLKKVFTGNIATGSFGAMMSVSLVNEGPVTIILDSKDPSF